MFWMLFVLNHGKNVRLNLLNSYNMQEHSIYNKMFNNTKHNFVYPGNTVFDDTPQIT